MTSATMDKGLGARIYRRLTSIPIWALWVMVALWTFPSVSLFLNSFRDRSDQQNTGFWQMGGELDRLTFDN